MTKTRWEKNVRPLARRVSDRPDAYRNNRFGIRAVYVLYVHLIYIYIKNLSSNTYRPILIRSYLLADTEKKKRERRFTINIKYRGGRAGFIYFFLAMRNVNIKTGHDKEK